MACAVTAAGTQEDMERPEDFEEREEPDEDLDGATEPDADGEAPRVDEDRSREGRFGSTEERRPDS